MTVFKNVRFLRMKRMYGLLAALEERLEVAIDAVEVVLEPQTRRRLVERQRLAEQILRRAVQHFALRALVHRDAAEHELGVQPVAALLQITAVGKLRDQVCGAEQVADDAVLRFLELDLIDVELVTREMHDAPDDGHELLEADARQVALEVMTAARHVRRA